MWESYHLNCIAIVYSVISSNGDINWVWEELVRKGISKVENAKQVNLVC